jgi:predicted RND superfamily exporter protein
MNKTSPLVLALLFTGASALRSRQDTTVASSATVPSTAVAGDASTTHPTNQYEEGDRIDEEENRRVVDSILEESNAILAS